MPPKTEKPKLHPIRDIQRAAVPLCAFETADPQATIDGIMKAVGNGKRDVSFLQWDAARGLHGLNNNGQQVVSNVENLAPECPFDQILTKLAKIETEDVILFVHNLHRFITNEFIAQAIWNLRDVWKSKSNILVMMAPGFQIPPELQQDVIVISEAAPTEDEILEIVHSVAQSASIEENYEEDKIVDATLGYLSGFAVEQAASLSVTKDAKGVTNFDLSKLWTLKVQNLKQTAGLEVSLPTETFKDLAGCVGIKDLNTKFLNGKEPPRAVLWLDEIEKMVAGGQGGDMSGTTQAVLEQFLTWTESRRVKGEIFLGIPGAGKSMSAKCIAGEAKVPLLRASMSTVKGCLVGQSEQQMKQLLKAVDAVAQGRVLMIATCNGIENLSPELMARFKLAMFFYDYPTKEETDALWSLYMKKFGLKTQPIPPSKNWVGREIESCCERAYLFECSLMEAAKSVVPVCIANASKMEVLRQSVSGRFLSASQLGIYTNQAAMMPANNQTRRMQ